MGDCRGELVSEWFEVVGTGDDDADGEQDETGFIHSEFLKVWSVVLS